MTVKRRQQQQQQQQQGRTAMVAMVMVVVCVVVGSSVREGGMGVAEAAQCSPFLLLNCVGTKGARDARCCNAVKAVLQPSCFCSEYRKGVVDASSVIPLAKRCNVNLRIGAKC